MLAFSDIIDFLLGLLRDGDARTQFERDPQGTLARAGLGGRHRPGHPGRAPAAGRLRGDVRHRRGRRASYPGGDDPVREIGYTTTHYAAVHHRPRARGAHATRPARRRNRAPARSSPSTTATSCSSSRSTTTTSPSPTTRSPSPTRSTQDNSTVTAIQANNSTDLFNSDDDVVAIQDNDVNRGPGGITVDTSAPTRRGGHAGPALRRDRRPGPRPRCPRPPCPRLRVRRLPAADPLPPTPAPDGARPHPAVTDPPRVDPPEPRRRPRGPAADRPAGDPPVGRHPRRRRPGACRRPDRDLDDAVDLVPG